VPAARFLEILRVLLNHRVEFVLVGGVAALLHGAPINTFDVDVVHSTEPENVDRLLCALDELDAVYRMQPDRRLRPDRSHLSSPGHQLTVTRFGPLDLLGAIGANRVFSSLAPLSSEMDLAPDVRVRVLNLEALIAVKEEAGSAKDLAVLPILRRTLKTARES
jgi:hypothetical protein